MGSESGGTPIPLGSNVTNGDAGSGCTNTPLATTPSTNGTNNPVKESVSKENLVSNSASSTDTLAEETKEGWPALSAKESKRTRTKSERSSARQTPTEEQHNNNNIKK